MKSLRALFFLGKVELVMDLKQLLMVGKWVEQFINQNEIHKFYASKEWRKLRREVLRESKYECQVCKQKGFYTKANHVHHNKTVREFPMFALSKTYEFQGMTYQNLVAVCKECHETVCHPDRFKHDKKQLNEERW